MSTPAKKKQLFVADFGDFSAEFFATKIDGDDRAFAIYKINGRNGVKAIEFEKRGFPTLKVGDMCPRGSILLDCLFPRFRFVVQGYT